MKKIFSYAVGIIILVCLTTFAFLGVGFAGTTTTSGITVQNIIDRAEVYLDSSDDNFFSDNDFVQWCNEATIDISARIGALEVAPITVTLVANTYRYSLGQDFLTVYAVEHDNNDTSDPLQKKTLDRVRKSDIGHDNSTGRPSVYCVWNDYLEIWPIPRTSEASTSLYVYTTSIPTVLVSTFSSIQTPTYFDTAILYYVVAQAWGKDNNTGKSAYYQGLYEKMVTEYAAIVQQRRPLE